MNTRPLDVGAIKKCITKFHNATNDSILKIGHHQQVINDGATVNHCILTPLLRQREYSTTLHSSRSTNQPE